MATTNSALDDFKLTYEDVKPHKKIHIQHKRQPIVLPKVHKPFVKYASYLVEVVLK